MDSRCGEGDESELVKTLTTSRFFVVGEIPKRRYESEIYTSGVRHCRCQRSSLLKEGRRGTTRHTLLDGFSDSTISECTFGVLSAPVAADVTALKTAESSWRREATWRPNWGGMVSIFSSLGAE